LEQKNTRSLNYSKSLLKRARSAEFIESRGDPRLVKLRGETQRITGKGRKGTGPVSPALRLSPKPRRSNRPGWFPKAPFSGPRGCVWEPGPARRSREGFLGLASLYSPPAKALSKSFEKRKLLSYTSLITPFKALWGTRGKRKRAALKALFFDRLGFEDHLRPFNIILYPVVKIHTLKLKSRLFGLRFGFFFN
jgi:hypothetical protein